MSIGGINEWTVGGAEFLRRDWDACIHVLRGKGDADVHVTGRRSRVCLARPDSRTCRTSAPLLNVILSTSPQRMLQRSRRHILKSRTILLRSAQPLLGKTALELHAKTMATRRSSRTASKAAAVPEQTSTVLNGATKAVYLT